MFSFTIFVKFKPEFTGYTLGFTAIKFLLNKTEFPTAKGEGMLCYRRELTCYNGLYTIYNL